jgi:hypothetical protein
MEVEKKTIVFAVNPSFAMQYIFTSIPEAMRCTFLKRTPSPSPAYCSGPLQDLIAYTACYNG